MGRQGEAATEDRPTKAPSDLCQIFPLVAEIAQHECTKRDKLVQVCVAEA
jgi:hypothetical protein